MPSQDIPAIDPEHSATLTDIGATLRPLEPIGAAVHGLDLTSSTPPTANVIRAIEDTMAEQGFVVFKNESPLAATDFLQASCWWGGKELHSTHGVHPATPGGDPHLFRLSNDHRQGIKGVGPQWHNDGSFNADTFSSCGLSHGTSPGAWRRHALRAASSGFRRSDTPTAGLLASFVLGKRHFWRGASCRTQAPTITTPMRMVALGHDRRSH